MSKRETPKKLELASIPFKIEAAAGDGLPRFNLVAYTGGQIKPAGWWDGVVVDLAGIDIQSQQMPLRFAHRGDWMNGVGHTENVSVSNGQLVAAGVVSRDTVTAREVVKAAMNGFPWQASIGGDVLEVEYLAENQTAQVNGVNIAGPMDIVRKLRLYEISIVDLGADPRTTVNIAAEHGSQEGEVIRMSADTNNNAATAGDQTPAPVAVTSVPAATPVVDPGVAQVRAAQAAETTRIGNVRRICAGHHVEIEARAISEGWDADKTELEVMRASRPKVAPVAGSGEVNLSPRVLECAIAQAVRLPSTGKDFDAATLQAAHSRFKGRIGLQELLLEAAASNGYSGRSFRQDPRAVLHAAFSSRDIAGVLSNIVNKSLLAGWMSVEMAWREVAAIGSVSDFKEIASYRLTAASQYKQVAPDGEIKHGSLGDLTYSNKADTYGLMLSVTRQDMINDDLNALSNIPRMLGRGGALKVNDVFWTEFLDNAAFFTSGNANYITGATAGDTTESRLAIDGLTRAERTLMDQTDTEGKPLGIRPEILLVPTRLKVPAMQLYNSTEIRNTTASTKEPTGNPHAGMFRPVVSSYLGNATYTGYSTLAWYLLANPADLATIEVVFLNGQESPTVESADADFNVLGIQFRGYHDFGVRLQEYRAGVKAKGEA
jgi:hypothetical protein